jgi:transcriptional regulator GlxA family with amidase domain
MLSDLQTPSTVRDLPASPEDHGIPPRAKINALPKWRLRRVEQHIDAHFDRRISLSELAGIAGLSRMHFAAQFRAATGYRPREYLLTRRVEHAKSLLTTTDKSLVEIALAVGFSTQAHFSTVFKRISGETSARWRSAFRTEAQPRRPPLHQNWRVAAVPVSAPVCIWPAAAIGRP